MSLAWQRRLCLAGVLAIALYAAQGIADGSYQVAGLAAGIALAFIAHRALGIAADATLVGLVLIGYIVGNRGFAQQSLLAGFPLLPAEFALGAGGTWLVIKSAFARQLPVRRDALNIVILLWLVAGTARLLFDLPRFRFLALRDYATVYYAGFFFLAQGYAGDKRVHQFLRGCLVVALALLPVFFFLSQAFPGFFLNTLTRSGVPLIFLKGDVAVPMMAAGVFFFHFAPWSKDQWWGRALSLGLLLAVAASNSRAAMVGLLVADAWLLLARRPRIPLMHFATLACAGLLLLTIAFSGRVKWAETQVHAAYERVRSITDIQGTGHYESGAADDKGDNNRFRLVWWRTVAEESLTTNPVFGLGFGADLSSRFIRNYDYVMGEDFTARSPHSIVFSLLGRMGLVGLVLLFVLLFIMAAQTWHTVRSGEGLATGYWCMVWTIFVSACFGVVMEGPMGAVPFWIILGLAHHESASILRPQAAAPAEGA